MKRSKQIALCGMLSALAVVIMLLAYFPYMTYLLPEIAGAVLAVILFEIDGKWATGAYVATALITIMMCEKESAVMFVGFFGYYPILKSVLERFSSRVLEYVVKFVLFNAAVVVSYIFIIYIFGIPLEGMEKLGRFALPILFAVANFAFLVYDRALTILYTDYMRRLHPKVERLMR